MKKILLVIACLGSYVVSYCSEADEQSGVFSGEEGYISDEERSSHRSDSGFSDDYIEVRDSHEYVDILPADNADVENFENVMQEIRNSPDYKAKIEAIKVRRESDLEYRKHSKESRFIISEADQYKLDFDAIIRDSGPQRFAMSQKNAHLKELYNKINRKIEDLLTTGKEWDDKNSDQNSKKLEESVEEAMLDRYLLEFKDELKSVVMTPEELFSSLAKKENKIVFQGVGKEDKEKKLYKNKYVAPVHQKYLSLMKEIKTLELSWKENNPVQSIELQDLSERGKKILNDLQWAIRIKNNKAISEEVSAFVNEYIKKSKK